MDLEAQAFQRIESEGRMLDLHGDTQDEAWSKTLDFLTEQIAMGEEGAKVMHGIGTGALKRMLL